MPDKPLFLTKLFNLYVYSQPLEVWADRTSLLPEEEAHTWTLKGGRNASIKGNESQEKGEGGGEEPDTPRTKSEESNPSRYDAVGLKCSNPTPFST